MMHDFILPESEKHWLELRTGFLNSTEISALFGCSPYLSRFELWHAKKAKKDLSIKQTARTAWGRRLQGVIAEAFAEEQKLSVRPKPEYGTIPSLRLGSSFDFETVEEPNALVEAKNVDALQFREGWLVDDDDIEAPPHIELQVQHQLLVSGRELAYIAALVGGNRPVAMRRERNDNVIARIIQEAEAFWDSIDRNEAPEPEYPGDAAAVCALFANAEPGKVLDASMNANLSRLAREYSEACQQEKWATELKKTLQAQILSAIGDHEKVLGDGFKISAGTVSVQAAIVERKAYSYRNFRLTMAKGNA